MCKLESYKCSLRPLNKPGMPKAQEKDELLKTTRKG
jgi:hypothetical protein